jgi:hypothetical protein
MLVAVAASTAAVTLAQLNLPDKYWKDNEQVLYASAAILSVAALAQLLQFVRWALSAKDVRKYEQDVRAMMSVCVVSAATHTSAPVEEIGVHIFRVGGTLRKRLVNVGGLRLVSTPTMIEPRWTKGKGVVGLAWKKSTSVEVDWEDYFATWEPSNPTAFAAQDADSRYGLTWGEFRLTRGYKRIVANPIHSSNGSIIGCATIDAPATLVELKSAPMQLVIHDVIVGAIAMGRPPMAWSGRAVK